MAAPGPNPHETTGYQPVNTPWTLLLSPTHQQKNKLEELLKLYRKPIYAFYRASGLNQDDADDLTQSFLLDFFLVKASFMRANPAKGRFRCYLLSAAQHSLYDFHKSKKAIRRGGQNKTFSLDKLKGEESQWEPAGGKTAEEIYDRQWAHATWDAAWKLFRSRNPGPLADALEQYYYNPDKSSHEDLAQAQGISISAFNSRLYAARQKLMACLREIVGAMVETPEQLAEELAELKRLLNRQK